jgi:signal peptide peptidase SppA
LNSIYAIRPDLFSKASAFVPTKFKDTTGYDLIAGVAVIPVTGVLVPTLGTMSHCEGATAYDALRARFLTALSDPAADAVAFTIDSGGGNVDSLFDLVDLIYSARAIKPTLAILSECAYSAAYAIASACEQITVPRTGGTGSIGIVAAHIDVSKMLENSGVKVTLLTYGAFKADGNEAQPLSDPAMARMQADINLLGELFVETVARNRGIPVDAVRKTEAGTFMGHAGVDAGLADRVMSPDAAFRELLRQLDSHL